METEDAEIAKAIAKSELEEHEKGNQRKGGDGGKDLVILYFPLQSTCTPNQSCRLLHLFHHVQL